MTPTMTIGDLTFDVRLSPRRKTMGITVDREGELILAGPEGCDLSLLERFVREKRFWIYTKLAEKEILRHPRSPKEFVTGEGFPHLGRSYRLLLLAEQDVPLKLEAGRFKLLRSAAPDGRRHFIHWYTTHAKSWLRRRLPRWESRTSTKPSSIEIRDLGFRWGSCTKTATLNFHWATILLPPTIIDYIILHELIHLSEPHHTPEFWQHVERIMPDFAQRKQWLAEKGAEFVWF